MSALIIEKLALRIPELGHAATRARLALGPVRSCPAPRNATRPPADAPWQPVEDDALWGARHGCVWLQAPLELPPAWRGQPVELTLRYPQLLHDQTLIGLEANLYLDGTLHAGIDTYHRTALLPQALHEGSHEAALLVYTRSPLRWEGLELHLRDEAIWQLHQQMAALLAVARELPAASPTRHSLLDALNAAYTLLDLREGWDGEPLAHSARQAQALLAERLGALPAAGFRPAVLANGHAHMDVAWLWPLWRTRQKIAHTVATALELMERHPAYVFSMSQPQTYAYLKEDHPALYERLRARVAEGRFEPVGAMWVEPDCNLASGESLIRQISHGSRFFEHEFGITPTVCWLPDVFGYSAALPQILRGCGIDTFLTIKLSWNQTNRFPHDTFRWQGLDGTSVLAHLISAPTPGHATEYTYNGVMSPQQVIGTWRHYRQQAQNQELLYLFGVGDGGGGPTESMLAQAAAMADLPEFPQVRLGRAGDYLQRLYERVYARPDLPTWAGELYLEYHRGTYTSQAAVKMANRRGELLYREADWLAAWAEQLGAAPRQQELDGGWKLLLLNQFHDILPGSSIAEVYQDARRDYAAIQTIGTTVADESLATIAAQIGLAGPSLLVLNSLPWERNDVAALTLPEGAAVPVLLTDSGEPLQTQLLGDGRTLLIDGLSVPSYGYAAYQQIGGTTPLPVAGLSASERRLESPHFVLELDDDGLWCRLYDKRFGRELLPAGTRANQLIAFEDRPLAFDAWDIDPFYEEKPYPLTAIESLRVVETGPVRASIEVVRRYGRSTITQRLSLYHSLPRIDVATVIDWRERQTLLKAAFPFDLNVRSATYEVQFGAVERPTHRNTSWDAARFEVCAHRWADLSEGGYGVALLNDGKYGYDALGSTMRLTLLKSAVSPDPTADEGEHRFTYSLLPHGGDWRASAVVRRAYELNAPLRPLLLPAQPGSLPPRYSWLRADAAHVVVETVKAADDGDGLIVRLYEAHNQRGDVGLTFAQELASAEECDMRERRLRDLPVVGQQVTVAVRPFEVKTLRVRLVSIADSR